MSKANPNKPFRAKCTLCGTIAESWHYAAKAPKWATSLVFLQDANDLLFAETASLHRLSPQLENRLTSNRGLFRGAGHLCNRHSA
ncbi:hypothetical protein CEW89_06535 [Celeribacter ethanolicus]|uniref:Uncharacterized protein n=1 Tax=Celeribacter ethanolicus TaxID=1758178 RepID=A0A291GAP7_9RHOB|nr:hypothetical protein [Celeribacter ethanolicus]ATG47255.1 hypothetical protein CEW89_06535 [Celeribacter ethanolicus]